jgi:Spy/CpxP family protein refolding chaperone
MKTGFILIFTIFFCFGALAPIQAQPRQGGNQRGICLNIPDLTSEQQSKIQSIRTEQLARANAHRAQMTELRARKRSLSIADNPDIAAIGNVIDQMEKLRSEHLKANAQQRQNIREVLTSEQRAYFDSRAPVRQGQGRNSGFDRRGQGRSGGMGRMR